VPAALLDVNLLVALFDADHVHHELAHDWFADHRAEGWATCPITENGFVRVLSHPAYGAIINRPADLIERLARLCASPDHEFWTDDVSLRDDSLFSSAHMAGHRKLTDVFLLGLAVARKGCLATFDRTIPVSAVVGATKEALAVIGSD
jgi:toxin-antitoxin system PIN domain toxin